MINKLKLGMDMVFENEFFRLLLMVLLASLMLLASDMYYMLF